jgi:hypothetical protein
MDPICRRTAHIANQMKLQIAVLCCSKYALCDVTYLSGICIDLLYMEIQLPKASSKINNIPSHNKNPWPESASKLYRPSDRRLSVKLVPTFEDGGNHVVSVMDP